MYRTFHSGRKSKSSSSSVSIDHDLAEGLVDLEKLQSAMESAVGKLQLDFRDKISTKILPSEYWHLLIFYVPVIFTALFFPIYGHSPLEEKSYFLLLWIEGCRSIASIILSIHLPIHDWIQYSQHIFCVIFLPLIKFTLYIYYYSLQQIKEQKCL